MAVMQVFCVARNLSASSASVFSQHACIDSQQLHRYHDYDSFELVVSAHAVKVFLHQKQQLKPTSEKFQEYFLSFHFKMKVAQNHLEVNHIKRNAFYVEKSLLS